jgi:ATP-dependent DNA helicase RecG
LLLTKYLRAGISYKGTQRLERLPVPEAALREAVINAIAHKDYGASIPIQISVYEHKLLLWNPGQLPQDWSLDRLLAKHPSQPTNPDIAKTLFLAGKIESLGRGIDLIRHACTAHGSPVPRFACKISASRSCAARMLRRSRGALKLGALHCGCVRHIAH